MKNGLSRKPTHAIQIQEYLKIKEYYTNKCNSKIYRIIKSNNVGADASVSPQKEKEKNNRAGRLKDAQPLQMAEYNLGITLIALIITVIVLLILAGVTLNLTIGSNGIFSKANSAKEKTIKSEMQEAISMAVQELQIEKLGTATLNDMNEEWLNNEKLVEKYNAKILNDNNKKKIRMKKNGIYLTCLIDANMNITICKAIGLSYTVDKTTLKDNKVKIKITVINDEKCLKTIEMPDGNIINCNGENEKEVEYIITLGQEYIIKIISEDESIDNEKIKIDSIPCDVKVELSNGAEMSNKSIVTDYGKAYENTIMATGDFVITGITATMAEGTLKVDNTTGKISTDKVTGDIQIIVTTEEMKISITEEVVNTSTSFGGSSSPKYSLNVGSNAYIKLKATTNIDGAQIKINPSIPYTITQNGNYNFIIKATYNGKSIEQRKEVIVNQYKLAKDLVMYDAGDWTKEEIEELKKQSLYDLNSEHIQGDGTYKILSNEGINLTFGGFTYKGDTENEKKSGVITSRNKSVDPEKGSGTNKYDGWQILDSYTANGKKYVTKLIHAGTPENFVYNLVNKEGTDAWRAEYILSSGLRKTEYKKLDDNKTIVNYRSFDMYKDKKLDAKGYIEEVHLMTKEEALKLGRYDGEGGIRCTGAGYWLNENGGKWVIYKVSSNGYCGSYDKNLCLGIRPVITLTSGVYVISGNGTGDSPYILGKD